MSRILLPVVFQETTKQLSFYENEKIGKIQESILYSFSLMIYNIEYTQVIWEDGSIMIMGEEPMSFDETWKSCLQKNQKEGKSIRRIEILDRKRDEKGNVIKENKIIDKYIQFEQNHSNQEFIESWNIPFHNFSNATQNVSFRNFESSLFQDLLQPNILQRLSRHIQPNQEHDTESISTESSEEEEEEEGEGEEREFLEIRNEYSEQDGNTMNIQISGTLQSSNPLFQLLEQSFQQLSTQGLSTNITIDEHQEESKEEIIENETEIEPEEIKEDEDNLPPLLDEDGNEVEREGRRLRRTNLFMNRLTRLRERNFFDTPRVVRLPMYDTNIIEDTQSLHVLENFMTNLFGSGHFEFAPSQFDEDVKVVINEEEFENLGHQTYQDIEEKEKYNQECIICTDNFCESDKVYKTNCGHIFHKDCIHPWLVKESTSCPICRKEIVKGHPKF
jgi:hypothetical protein